MKPPIIFPVPKQVDYGEGWVTLAAPGEQLPLWVEGEEPLVRRAAALLEKAAAQYGFPTRLVGSAAEARIQLSLGEAPLPPTARNPQEGYALAAEGAGVRLTARAPRGLLWAAQTLSKLLSLDPQRGLCVPEVSVRDWPDLAYRGLFCESRWGPDLMTLADWQAAVDYLLELKFNILTVGVYNCWPIQYYGRPSEWLMVPIRAFPQLRSPQRIDYYSPTRGAWVRQEYLPRMFEEDFFGALVAYGAERGMVIRPHFNTPGHNTLLPRLLPEISARDEQGQPTGYGFCISNPRTYEVMFTIVDEICQRYLLPYGVRSYHLAGDEVYPLRGVHPDRPHALISPWCRCAECRQRSEGELYVEYLVRLASHLRALGIEDISMWYDQLVRGGQLNEELVRRLEEAGIRPALILHWWRYWDFFATTHPEFGFRRWVTPMTGYFYQTSYRGQLENIYLAARKAEEEGCEGAEAYGLFDRSFDRHFRALAEMAWNSSLGRTPEEFIQLYAREVFGDDWVRGLDGLRIFGTLVDAAVAQRLTYSLFRYSHDYAQTPEQATARDNYPQYTIIRLATLPPWNAEGLLSGLASEARRARACFAAATWRRAELRTLYLIECDRLELVAEAFATCVRLVREYEHHRATRKSAAFLAEEGRLLPQGEQALSALLARFDELMTTVETHKDHYLVPHFLRELSLLRAFLANLRASFATIAADAQAGRLVTLPELEILRLSPVQFPD
jgi:hypothetical protein